MLRFMLISLVSFAIIISCMGQTFQYSRGWTNGKRSSTFSQLHENSPIAEIFEVTESERRLEKCIIQLQRLIHNPFLIRPSSYVTSTNGMIFSNANSDIANIRHQPNEIFEDSVSEAGEFSSKQK